jgi:hypothetical protein
VSPADKLGQEKLQPAARLASKRRGCVFERNNMISLSTPVQLVKTPSGAGRFRYRSKPRPRERQTRQFRYDVSWQELARVCPGLLAVQEEAARGGPKIRWPVLKRRIGQLVGWNIAADEPAILRSQESWNVAVRHIHDIFENAGGAR